MDNITIEEFRKIMEGELGAKGVKPPIHGSKKEQELFEQWLKGKENLLKLTKNGKHN